MSRSIDRSAAAARLISRACRSMPGEMQITIALRKVDCGTELEIVQEGLPSVIPVEACYLGWRWQGSLSLLTHLVEAETPD
jgi:hypothetical protein